MDVDRRTFLHSVSGLAAVSVMGTSSRRLTAANVPAESDLPFLSLVDVAKLIRSKEISSTELTSLMLKRIEKIDGTWNAYATVMAKSAIKEARQADREIAKGEYRGPLHGMPIAVKDLCYTKGVRTMAGCAVRMDFIPDHDATVVSRYKQAGAVMLGKLNLTEGAMAGYNRKLEVPVNPWDAGAWPGCSSSGSGVAAAGGLAFGTLGSDTGGSIRFPSAACGIVGLKPTWGRVSRYGVLALAESLDTVGPMTRSVADAAVMLQAIAGSDTNDPTTLPDPVPDYSPSDGRLKGIRIGVDEKYNSRGVHPEVSAGVLAAVEVLADLGATIVNVKVPDMSEHVAQWTTLCRVEALLAHREFYPTRRDEYGVWYQNFLDKGATVGAAAKKPPTAEEYAHAVHHRLVCNGKFARVFQNIDFLACPSSPALPHPVTPELQYGLDSAAGVGANWGQFTNPSNYNGAPTLSVPCGFSRTGLPLSLQLVGKQLQEAALIQAGHCYEQATDWHTRRPPMKASAS